MQKEKKMIMAVKILNTTYLGPKYGIEFEIH